MGPGEPLAPRGPTVGDDAAARLARLESGWATARAQAGTPSQRAARLAALEQELLCVVGSGRDLAGGRDPALASAALWRRQCRRHAPECAAAVEALLARRLRASVDARARVAASPVGAPACFARLVAAAEEDREALDLLDAPDGGADVAAWAADLEPLRAAFLAALAAEPPDDRTRAAWTQDLVDRAQAVRTGLEDRRPELAARHLTRAAEELAWHRAHVEADPGPRRRALARAERRLSAAAEERRLEAALDRRFGARRVVRWERLVFSAVAVVL